MGVSGKGIASRHLRHGVLITHHLSYPQERERESIVYVIKSVSIYTYLKLLKQGFLYGDDVCVCIYIER